MTLCSEWWNEGLKVAESQELDYEEALVFAWVYLQERIDDLLDRIIEED